jgi:hypothetical protein
MFFYREAPPPPVIELKDGFEHSDGWPGTLNTNPQFLTPSVSDGFESADGWSGTT